MKSLLQINWSSISTQLMVVFLSIGILTVSLVGTFAYFQLKKVILHQGYEHLISVRDIKAKQVESYFQDKKDNISLFAINPLVTEALQRFTQAYFENGPKSVQFDSLEMLYGPKLKILNDTYGYYDLFLVTMDGEIVYTVAKEADFATNLLNGPYSNQNIATAFKAGRSALAIADFMHYAPSNGDPASFIATPVLNAIHKPVGVIILQVPLDKIDEIMQEKSGMGETGESYLVGNDYLMRSDSRFSTASTVLKKEVKTESVTKAFDGTPGMEIIDDYRGIAVLSAYGKVHIPGLDWVILTEIDYAEVMAPIIRLRNWIILLGIGLSLGLGMMGYVLAQKFKVRIDKLVGVVSRLGKGEAVSAEAENKKDEIARMNDAVNGLSLSLHSLSEFASEIGRGNLTTAFTPLSEKDVLGNALIQMRDNLLSVQNEDQKRNWATEGLTTFADLLRMNQNDLNSLCNAVIAKLVKYLAANQGALFIVNDEKKPDEYLELVAFYAWGKVKHLQKRIEKGEGLAGQVWLEKELTCLTEVPPTYVEISSGLGKASPQCIIVVPLIINDEVFGVIEMAAFRTYEAHELAFIKKLAETLAATISSVKVNDRTLRLLEQSQQMAEELRAQEEEMRQNMEELSATQEELSRKENEYLKQIASLEMQLTGKGE